MPPLPAPNRDHPITAQRQRQSSRPRYPEHSAQVNAGHGDPPMTLTKCPTERLIKRQLISLKGKGNFSNYARFGALGIKGLHAKFKPRESSKTALARTCPLYARDLKFVAPFGIHRIFCITRPETKTQIDAKRRDLHNDRIAALAAFALVAAPEFLAGHRPSLRYVVHRICVARRRIRDDCAPRHPCGNHASALGGQALKWPNGTRGKAILKAMAAGRARRVFRGSGPGNLRPSSRSHPPPGRARAKGEEMIATSHGRNRGKIVPKRRGLRRLSRYC